VQHNTLAELCAGEQCPIAVVFKASHRSCSAVEEAMQSSAFNSVLSVIYWATAPSSGTPRPALPHLSFDVKCLCQCSLQC
jgi:hypothetical protein